MKTLVIGYGNTLRSDDGAGQIVATRITEWNLPQVISLSVHQLTPELAENISQADQVIFVDAAANVLEKPELIKIEQLSSKDTETSLGHTCTPQSLLSISQTLYSKETPSYLMLIPAINFDFGEQLSSLTQTGINIALAKIKELIK